MPDHRYLNFPLVMLAGTITEPERIHSVMTAAIDNFARTAKPRAWQEALVQLAYLANRGAESFTAAATAVMKREPIAELIADAADALNESGAEVFREFALAEIEERDIELPEQDRAAIAEAVALHDAAHFFNQRPCAPFEASRARLRQEIAWHEAEYGPLVFASCPLSFYEDTLRQSANVEAMRVWRLTCAMRSIVGTKATARATNKGMIAARACGAKTPAVAASMAADNPAIATELEALQSRKRIDRLLAVVGKRGLVTSLGVATRRCIYISTRIKSPRAMADHLAKKWTSAGYRRQQSAARAMLPQKGQRRGQREGQREGQLKQYSINKAL